MTQGHTYFKQTCSFDRVATKNNFADLSLTPLLSNGTQLQINLVKPELKIRKLFPLNIISIFETHN